jgi:DNA binding domain, excisionase family
MISKTLTEKIGDLDAILTVDEAATFFSVCPITIYRMIYQKELDAYKDGDGAWCIARSEIRRYCTKKTNL